MALFYKQFRRRASDDLLHRITDILSLNTFQTTSLSEFSDLFIDAIYGDKYLTNKSIDSYIDWLYFHECIIPDVTQYRSLGMNVIPFQAIYISKELRSSFPNWNDFRQSALNSGLLLTSIKSAPSIELWLTELSSFLPYYFGDEVPKTISDWVYILESIVQFASEAFDEFASIPCYVARILDLDHRSEYEQISLINKQIDFSLRQWAKFTLKIPVEDPPDNALARIKRIASHADRIKIVKELRIQALLRWELRELKSLIK